LLPHRPIVFVGLISYSMYLWHWPIFALLRYRGIVLFPAAMLAVVAGIVLISCLSWRFVEKPCRESRIGFVPAVVWMFAAPACVFLAFGAVSYFSGGIPWRFAPQIRALMSSYSRETTLPRSCSQSVSSAYVDVRPESLSRGCILGDPAAEEAAILLFGDSHASHFKPFIDVLARDAHLKGVYHLMGSCPPLTPPDEPGRAYGGLSPQALCAQHNLNLLRLAGHYRFVAIAGFWETALPDLADGLSREIDAVAQSGATPVLFRDSPSAGRDVSQCVVSRARGWIPSDTDCNIPTADVLLRQKQENDIIDRIEARHPEMIVIDPRRVLCSGSECLTEIDHLAVYRDSNHLNEKAARDLAEKYIRLRGNPFRR
jgi:hypothetical protein